MTKTKTIIIPAAIKELKKLLKKIFPNNLEIIKYFLSNNTQYPTDVEILINKTIMSIIEDYLGTNKPEKLIEEILNNLNLEFIFTGKRRKENRIGIKYPDFTDKENKLIIEMHGDYWHNLPNQPHHRTEKGTIEYYETHGYKTLVIWEKELKKQQQVIDKIRFFIKQNI